MADNIESRMNLRYSEYDNRPKALASDAGVSLSTVQRVLEKKIGASVDTLALIAGALDCSVVELFVATNELIRSLGLTRAETANLIPQEWRQARE